MMDEPFGALDEDDKGPPLPNPNLCRRCGVCLGACPERIVSFKDYSVNIVASMIKAVEVPEEYEEKPRILALMCENDAVPALDLAGQQAAMHGRVQGLDAPVHHFRKTCHIGDVTYLKPCFAQRLGRSAGGQQFHTAIR